MPKFSVLVVDDDSDILLSLKGFLEDEGYTVVTASTGREGVSKAESLDVDAVMLDLMLPDAVGIDILSEIKSFKPELAVIMISGMGTIDIAVRATKLGAYDFIEKPLDPDRVLLSLQRALQLRKLEAENLELRERLGERYRIVGKGTAMADVSRLIDKVAPTEATVLIRGESGVGKEVVARAIYSLSRRSKEAASQVLPSAGRVAFAKVL